MSVPVDRRFRAAIWLGLAAGCAGKADALPTPESIAEATPAAAPTPAPPAEGPPAQTRPCTPPVPDLLGGGTRLSLAVEAEHVALRSRSELRVQTPPSDGAVTATGPLCAGDPTCAEALAAAGEQAALRSDCGQTGCIHYHLAWSGPDAQGVVRDLDGLIAVLGTVDTADEARLLAWARGYDQPCPPEPNAGGWVLWVDHEVSDCPMQTDDVRLRLAADGGVEELERVEGERGPCVGRLAPGHQLMAGRDVGGWLAQAAAMEASAALAFDHLAQELCHHQAPASLVAAAREAAVDERRHAAAMSALARSRGANLPSLPPIDSAIRTRRALLLNNAVEGMGREVWGSLLALWQARHAPDPELRRVMTSIAIDELRHAELSRALHRWLAPRCSAQDRADADVARRGMWLELTLESSRFDPRLGAALGLPVGAVARRLAAATEEALAHTIPGRPSRQRTRATVSETKGPSCSPDLRSARQASMSVAIDPA